MTSISPDLETELRQSTDAAHRTDLAHKLLARGWAVNNLYGTGLMTGACNNGRLTYRGGQDARWDITIRQQHTDGSGRDVWSVTATQSTPTEVLLAVASYAADTVDVIDLGAVAVTDADDGYPDDALPL